MTDNDTKDKFNIKCFLSVLMLYAGASARRLLLIAAGMMILETGFFAVSLGKDAAAISLESAVYSVRIPILVILALTYAGFCFFLSTALTSKTGKPEYTVRRLRISGKEVLAAGCLYDVLMFVILYGAQTAAFLLMMWIYAFKFPANMNDLSAFMACCRVDILYSFLPMPSSFEWIRNGLKILALGILASANSVKARNSGQTFTFILAALIEAVIFIRSFTDHVLWIFPSFVVLIFMVYDLLYCSELITEGMQENEENNK